MNFVLRVTTILVFCFVSVISTKKIYIRNLKNLVKALFCVKMDIPSFKKVAD
jgi:hypothetical protein